MDKDQENELLSFSAKILTSSLNRCLYKAGECRNKAIKAHSIQNATSLDLLESKGHVIGLINIFKGKNPPENKFAPVGRNKASTFTGLCSVHDSSLFELIDNNPFDIKNEKQLFLLMYRSVFRELHACIDTAIKCQSAYQKQLDLGLELKDTHTELGMLASQRHIVAYEANEYKEFMDRCLFEYNYIEFGHISIVVTHENPSLATSALVSLDDYTNEKGTPMMTINIFPISKKETLVVFSFKKSDEFAVDNILSPIITAKGDQMKYEISKLVLNMCENFFIAPSFFGGWSLGKKKAIENFFQKTLFYNNTSHDDEKLMLFTVA